MKALIGTSLAVAILALTGCATPVDRTAESPYCHKHRGIAAACTKENAPSLSKDQEAKQFVSDPSTLTLYVVRYWGDGDHPLEVSINSEAAMETVPNSMIRLRLKPGNHKVSFVAAGKAYERTIDGSAGDVKLLGITGTDWAWGSSSHGWSDDSDEEAKKKARQTRLIKDVSVM
ncbi:hypothetical protein [Ottowia testudinis]|uniref:Lipoprotein n=1 Tax=Ottowia testudinis TaxID=2816950 RepID=A0A975CFP8_9BURK|nr:hypothetical protein [Ottowia testudinis]QTD44952.1 hypothetical protein J1M35_18175 [Ottowia testudinis]